MKNSDYLIVGGGVAGTTAAEFIRMGDSEGSITIITEEPERLYSRVMMPHFLRDQVPFERLYVRKPEQYEEKNVELLTNPYEWASRSPKNSSYLCHSRIASYQFSTP